MNNPLPVQLDLSPFKKFKHRLMISEAEDASMQVIVTPLDTANEWEHDLPPRGGFILRLDK
jgi:hypothetical protein